MIKGLDNFKLKNLELLYGARSENLMFLILLIFTDLAFILLHITYKLGILPKTISSIMLDASYLEIYQEASYAEAYQYIKEYWIVLLLLFIAIKKAQTIYFAWSSLFGYFLLDDSLQIHEKLGEYIVNYFSLQPLFGLRAQDLGELAISIFFGLIIFSFIGVAYFKCDNKAKKVSQIIFFLVLFLVLFGVVLDMVDVIIPVYLLKALFGLIEDGGEMIVMSIILGYVYNASMS